MNAASIITLCIVGVLFVLSVVRSGKAGGGKCDGNCAGCASRTCGS